MLDSWIEIQNISKKLGVGTWSYHKLVLFENCPRLFQNKYLCAKPLKVSDPNKIFYEIPAKVGIFIHKVMETCLQEPDTPNSFSSAWVRTLKTCRLVTEEKLMADRLRPQVNAIVLRLRAAAVKYTLDIQIEKMLTVPGVVGFADYVGASPDGRHVLLLDFKTHSHSLDREKKVTAQLTFYAMLLFEMYADLGLIDIGCAYIPDADVKTIKSIHREELFEIEKHWVRRINTALGMLEVFMRDFPQIQAAGFPPSKGDACEWCSDRKTCEEFKKKKKRKKKKPSKLEKPGKGDF